MFDSKTTVNTPAIVDLPLSETTVAVFDVDVFCEIMAPSGASRDAFQHPPLQLGKETSIVTTPEPDEFMK